eukprot:10529707-Prorocentrum_lima.AAC.1
MACCTESLMKARSSAKGLSAQTGTWVSPPRSTGRGSWQAESVATGSHACDEEPLDMQISVVSSTL